MTPICDFCNEPAPRHKRYEAKSFLSFTVGNVSGGSLGDWCACPVCSRMIDGYNWDGLLDYSVASFIVNNPGLATKVGEDVIRLSIKDLHQRFKESRRGT